MFRTRKLDPRTDSDLKRPEEYFIPAHIIVSVQLVVNWAQNNVNWSATNRDLVMIQNENVHIRVIKNNGLNTEEVKIKS